MRLYEIKSNNGVFHCIYIHIWGGDITLLEYMNKDFHIIYSTNHVVWLKENYRLTLYERTSSTAWHQVFMHIQSQHHRMIEWKTIDWPFMNRFIYQSDITRLMYGEVNASPYESMCKTSSICGNRTCIMQ